MSDESAHLVEILMRLDAKIVFAESCTGGLVAATLAQIPGVSKVLCGSAVTYRDEVKVAWVDVDPQTIAEKTAVCGEVALQMAAGVLSSTPSARFSVSVTGHLGPDSPAELDGTAFIGFASTSSNDNVPPVQMITFQSNNRLERQVEATRKLLRITAEWLQRIEVTTSNCHGG